jgi:hypothetical protein
LTRRRLCGKIPIPHPEVPPQLIGDFLKMADVQTPEQAIGSATSKEFNFFFRTDKIRDDEGKVIGNGRKHPDVKAVLPIPTYKQIAHFLHEGGKEAELILDALTDAIDRAARAQINDFRETQGLDKDFTATHFDLAKLSITAIANTPKSERAGAAISDEDWTAFLDDYSHVMVHVVGYEDRKVKLAVMHFKVQLRRIKNDKPAVQKLLDLLNVWAAKTENLEDHMACYDDLTKRAAKYLKAEEKNVAEAL